MRPTTSTIQFLDSPDPWGFRNDDSESRSVVIQHFEPIDEPVDADEPLLAPLPVSTPSLTCTSTARAGSPAAPDAGSRGLRLPFPSQMMGVLAAFAAVIMVQAFYIGFSLTGEASARLDGEDAAVASSAGHARVVEVRPEHRTVAVPARPVGALRVDTGHAPANIFIDGVLAGPTPFSRADLAAGEYAVRVEFPSGAVVTSAVTVPERETVSLVLDPPLPSTKQAALPAAPVAGWVRVNAAFDVEVFDAGQLVGSSQTDRIMLTPGAHELELVNSALGFRSTVKTAVVAGTLVPVTLDTPRVPVAINAQPWAEVIVNGRVHGETPVADLLLPIGVHEIVLRHPDLGERAETVTVRAIGSTRIAADLRR